MDVSPTIYPQRPRLGKAFNSGSDGIFAQRGMGGDSSDRGEAFAGFSIDPLTEDAESKAI